MNLCKTCGTICPFDDERTECDAYAPMTNENWLRSCTTEQLAEWIVHLADDCTMQHECNLCNSWCDEKRVIEWLKQPHKPFS